MNKISIVTISYNKVEFIEETILSVINQSYKHFEYIIVDAGSTDGSIDIIEKYRNKLSHYINEPDNGPAQGLNKGFKHATGDIFAFINADDTLLPGAFKIVNQYFKKNTNVDCLLGNGYKIDRNSKVIRKVHSDNFNVRQYLSGALTVFQPAIFFRKEAFLKIGGFNEQNKINWDGELLLDLALNKAKIKGINTELGNIRIYDETITASKDFQKKYNEQKHLLYKKVFNKSPSLIGQKLLFHYFRVRKIFQSPSKFITYLKNGH